MYEKSALRGRRVGRVKVSRRVEEAHRRGVARSSRVAQQATATDRRRRGAVKQ